MPANCFAFDHHDEYTADCSAFDLNWCLRCFPLPQNAPQFDINPLIYYVNRYFLMFGGSQVQKPYHASMNGFLTFGPWHHHLQKGLHCYASDFQ